MTGACRKRVHKTTRQRAPRPVQKKATLCVTFLVQGMDRQWERARLAKGRKGRAGAEVGSVVRACVWESINRGGGYQPAYKKAKTTGVSDVSNQRGPVWRQGEGNGARMRAARAENPKILEKVGKHLEDPDCM